MKTRVVFMERNDDLLYLTKSVHFVKNHEAFFPSIKFSLTFQKYFTTVDQANFFSMKKLIILMLDLNAF